MLVGELKKKDEICQARGVELISLKSELERTTATNMKHLIESGHLEGKEEEINKLKSKFVFLTKEMNEYTIQVEEAKLIKETLRNHVIEKDNEINTLHERLSKENLINYKFQKSASYLN